MPPVWKFQCNQIPERHTIWVKAGSAPGCSVPEKQKEGMNMAREFGAKSFNPETVSFISSGSQPSGLPWKMLNRKLPKNILLAASDNPSTIEELSIELGIAVPYMEEEVERLVDATLLKKTGDRYVTDFFIMGKDTQLAIYKSQRQSSPERSKLLDAIASDSLPQLRDLDIVRNDMSDNDLKWWAVLHLTDDCIQQSGSYTSIYQPAKRANGEEWGIIGYEQADLPETCIMNHNGYGWGADMLWCYTPSDYGLWDRDEGISYEDTVFLADIIRNGRNLSSFSTSEQRQWKTLENRFAHADGDGNIIPDVLVIYFDNHEKIREIWRSHPLYAKVRENVDVTFGKTIEILRKNANPVLHDRLLYCASMQMLDCRMMTLHDEVDSGRLVPPEDPAHSKIGMFLVLARAEF